VKRRLLITCAIVILLAGAYVGIRTFAQSPSPANADAFLFASEVEKIRQASSESTLGVWRERLLQRARNEAASDFPLEEKGNLAVAPIVARLALAVVLTGDESLRQAAVRDMRRLLALDSWTSSRHRGMCDLHAADTAVAVALAYCLLRPELSKAERTLVISGLSRLATKPYLNDVRKKRWNVTNSFNWNGVINGGMLAVALLLEPEGNPRIEPAARQLLQRYLNHFADDGGWDEAADYLWYGLHNPSFAAYLADKRGRSLAFPNEVLEAPSWQEKFTSPSGRTPPFGDATWRAKPSSAAGYLALASGDPAAMRAFATRGPSTDPIDLLYLGDLDEINPPPAPPPPKRYISPIGWAVACKGDAWLAIRGGLTSANHSHLDLGSFVLEAGGKVLLTDPGVPHPYPYSEGYFDPVKRWQHPAVRSSSHSTIVIGANQQTLTARFDVHLEDDALVGEMTQGYGDALKRWRRTWRLQSNTLMVEDVVELSFPQLVTWSFVAPEPWNDTVHTRRWQSAGFNLQIADGPTPASVRRAEPVLGRAYPLEISLPLAESFHLEWRFRWAD